jgi:hypothetical protein
MSDESTGEKTPINWFVVLAVASAAIVIITLILAAFKDMTVSSFFEWVSDSFRMLVTGGS